MKAKYEEWRYEHLTLTKAALEEMLWTGEDHADVRDHLNAVEAEIATRRYVLLGVWDGRVVKEYGRWRTDQQCFQMAETMGLPPDGDFTLGGKPFKTIVRRC